MDVVTGSFGYIGKYITRELLNKGHEVKTITTHPNKPNPFGDKVEASNYHFDNPDRLTQELNGCEVLFNTYWVRFNYRQWSFDKALEHTKTLQVPDGVNPRWQGKNRQQHDRHQQTGNEQSAEFQRLARALLPYFQVGEILNGRTVVCL